MKTKQAVKFFGNQAKLARALDITESAVSRWGLIVPIRQAVRLQSMSSNELLINLRDYEQ